MLKLYSESKIKMLMNYLKNSKCAPARVQLEENSVIKSIKEEYCLPKYELLIHIEKRAINSEDYKIRLLDITNLNSLEKDKSELENKIVMFEKEIFFPPKKEKVFFKSIFNFLK